MRRVTLRRAMRGCAFVLAGVQLLERSRETPGSLKLASKRALHQCTISSSIFCFSESGTRSRASEHLVSTAASRYSHGLRYGFCHIPDVIFEHPSLV